MEIKKTVVLMILCVFLISMLSVGILADNHERDRENSIRDDSENKRSDQMNNDREAESNKAKAKSNNQLNRAIGAVSDTRERIGNVKDRQRTHFEEMLAKCSDNEGCKKNIGTRQEMIEKLDEKKLNMLEKFQDRRIKASQKLVELKEGKHFEKFNEENKARHIEKENVDEHEKKFKEHKEKYENAKKMQKEHREKFNDAREEWREKCANDDATEDCTRIKRELAGNAVEHLKNTLERIENHILKFEDKVQSNEHISEDEEANILARIEGMQEQLADAREQVESLNEDSTKEEVRAIAEVVKDVWHTIKDDLRVETGQTVNARVGGFLVKAEQMSVRLAKLLERLTETDVDTTDLELLVDQYNQQHDLAKQKYAEAADLFDQVRELEGEDKVAKIHEAQDAMNEAKEQLKDAHRTLKSIHELLKDLDHTQTLEELDAETEE